MSSAAVTGWDFGGGSSIIEVRVAAFRFLNDHRGRWQGPTLPPPVNRKRWGDGRARGSTTYRSIFPVSGPSDRLRPTQTRPSGFSKAAPRSAPAFSCFASTKQPLVIYGSRPQAAGRCDGHKDRSRLAAAVRTWGRMSAVAKTGRSEFPAASDCSTLRPDVHQPSTGLPPTACYFGRPMAAFECSELELATRCGPCARPIADTAEHA